MTVSQMTKPQFREVAFSPQVAQGQSDEACSGTPIRVSALRCCRTRCTTGLCSYLSRVLPLSGEPGHHHSSDSRVPLESPGPPSTPWW